MLDVPERILVKILNSISITYFEIRFNSLFLKGIVYFMFEEQLYIRK